MHENIEIRVFTIQDLIKWLNTGDSIGLSYDVISNARALAFINNPYATLETPAIAVAFNGERAVGYTAVFPDKKDGEIIYWGTTGFIDASMRGRGVGTKLYSSMMQATENRWLASDSTPAALTISKKTGLHILYFDRTYLLFKEAHHTLKGLTKEFLIQRANKRVCQRLQSNFNFQIVRYIDEPTYQFIVSHNEHGMFLREREMLNWILQYPFVVDAPNTLNSFSSFEFGTVIPQYSIYGIRLMCEQQLLGFAMFRQSGDRLTLLYLFKDEDYKNRIYESLIYFVLQQDISQFWTLDNDFLMCFNELGCQSMNTKTRIHKITLSYPSSIEIDTAKQLQCGDGDMFA